MNQYEKSEFERHKKAAEKQLNEMYYGTNAKSKNNNGIPMPSFISLPNNGQNKEQSHVTDGIKNNKEKTENTTAEKHEPSPQKKQSNQNLGKNILSMLNFKGMKMDNDRLIILAVCLLLAGEETDELLMLALIYIML